MFGRAVVVVAALLTAIVGAAVTGANRWGAGAVPPCRDTFDGGAVVLPMCVAPQSPEWALALGALLPALAVITSGALWLRRR